VKRHRAGARGASRHRSPGARLQLRRGNPAHPRPPLLGRPHRSLPAQGSQTPAPSTDSRARPRLNSRAGGIGSQRSGRSGRRGTRRPLFSASSPRPPHLCVKGKRRRTPATRPGQPPLGLRQEATAPRRFGKRQAIRKRCRRCALLAACDVEKFERNGGSNYRPALPRLRRQGAEFIPRAEHGCATSWPAGARRPATVGCSIDRPGHGG